MRECLKKSKKCYYLPIFPQPMQSTTHQIIHDSSFTSLNLAVYEDTNTGVYHFIIKIID